MSSNIRLTRVCQFCKKEFTAKTTVTKCCSDDCAKKLYKQRQRDKKIEQSKKETMVIISKPITDLQIKEFLSIDEVSELVGVSRWTIENMVKQGKIKSVRFGRRIIIKRNDLNSL